MTKTTDQKIAEQTAKLQKLDEQIGRLMARRANAEETLATLIKPASPKGKHIKRLTVEDIFSGKRWL